MSLAVVSPLQLDFPHAATVLAVHSTVTAKKTGAVTTDTRVFVSSLEATALTPRQWLARIRGHWTVESANHWRRDQVWGEDREHGRNARRACNLALLRSALLGLLLRDGSLNLSALSQDYASHPAIALRLLGRQQRRRRCNIPLLLVAEAFRHLRASRRRLVRLGGPTNRRPRANAEVMFPGRGHGFLLELRK